MITSFTNLALSIATKRIKQWLSIATPKEIREGMAWYDDAMAYARFLSVTFGVSRVIAAAVISALSPNNRWERNKLDAYNLIKAYVEGRDYRDVKVCTYDPNKIRAWRILTGEIEITKASRKTYAFALNVGDNDASVVTLDKWMARVFSTTSLSPKETPTSFTPMQYDRLSNHFVIVAKRLGYKPYELQAVLWVVIRNRWLKTESVPQGV